MNNSIGKFNKQKKFKNIENLNTNIGPGLYNINKSLLNKQGWNFGKEK